jgi:hypothetical protein
MLDILGGLISGIPGKVGVIATLAFLVFCALLIGVTLLIR